MNLPAKCAACRDDSIRDAIDLDLAAGNPYRELAKKYAISKSALLRHRKNHPAPSLVKLTLAPASPQVASSIVAEAERVMASCWAALRAAERSKSLSQIALHHRELRGSLELWARAVTAHDSQRSAPVIDLEKTQEWIELRTFIIRTLDPYPDAYRAMADALREEARKEESN